MFIGLVGAAAASGVVVVMFEWQVGSGKDYRRSFLCVDAEGLRWFGKTRFTIQKVDFLSKNDHLLETNGIDLPLY